MGRERREARCGRRAHGRLGHRRGPQRGGRALLPARVARGRARPVARPHPQAGPAGARRDARRPAGAARAARPCLWQRVQDDIAVALAAETVGAADRRPGRGHRLHLGTHRLRQAGRDLPDGAAPAGRDVPAGRDGSGRLPVRRLGVRHRGARAGAGGRHGVELRGGCRRAGDGRRHPAARRRGVHLGQRCPLPLQAGEAERSPGRWRRIATSSSGRAVHRVGVTTFELRPVPPELAASATSPRAPGTTARSASSCATASWRTRRGGSGSGRPPTPISALSATCTRSRCGSPGACGRSGSAPATWWPSSCPIGSRPPSPSTPAA